MVFWNSGPSQNHLVHQKVGLTASKMQRQFIVTSSYYHEVILKQLKSRRFSF